jgi:hypothetical protein
MSLHFVRSADCQTGRASGPPRPRCVCLRIYRPFLLRFVPGFPPGFPLFACPFPVLTRYAASHLTHSAAFKTHSLFLGIS